MIRNLLLFLTLLSWMACTGKDDKAREEASGQDPQLVALSRLIEQNPDNDSLLFRRAELYYALGGFDEALIDLNRAMQLDSLQPAYYHLLADVLIDYGRPNDSKRAIEVLKLASSRFPDRLVTWLKLSEFYLIVRQYNDALQALEQVLIRDPQNAEAYFMTGRVALDMGDTTRSVAAFQKSVQLDAANLDGWMFLGRIFSNRDNPLALQYFDNALRLDSTYLEAKEFKGVFYKRQGQFDRAFDIYRDIVRVNPDYSNAYFDMGMIYLEIDSLGKARDNFDIAIKTDPLFVKAYYYRGVCAELQGQAEAALADYRQANKMSPQFQEAADAIKRLSPK